MSALSKICRLLPRAGSTNQKVLPCVSSHVYQKRSSPSSQCGCTAVSKIIASIFGCVKRAASWRLARRTGVRSALSCAAAGNDEGAAGNDDGAARPTASRVHRSVTRRAGTRGGRAQREGIATS